MKKPHPVVQKFWDERYITLSKFVKEQLAKMDSEAPVELGSVKNNLFVDEDLSEVVSRNFDRTYTELKELKGPLLERRCLSQTKLDKIYSIIGY